MQNSKLLFDKLSTNSIDKKPFPHIVTKETLDRVLLSKLIAERPNFKDYAPANIQDGQKVYIKSKDLLSNKNTAKFWQEMIFLHTEKENIHKVLDFFKNEISDQYPELTKKFGQFCDWKIGKRWQENSSDFDIVADAQLVYHAPVKESFKQERVAHVKTCNKLIQVFYMLKLPEDTNDGGDFEFYEPMEGAFIAYGAQQQVLNPKSIKLCKTIKYEANTAIYFLNGPKAIQTFSARKETKYPIFYLNILLELNNPLFYLPTLTKEPRKNV